MYTELTYEQLTKLKEIELAMFKEFIAVCEKLNIKYYLLGGTLLGAVRHKGFIPWDDDIDVGLLREDYEKFIAHAQELLPEKYFVQNFRTDPEFPTNITKIRNSHTTFRENSIKNCNVNHGVFIDVFPLDYYPEDVKKQKAIERKKKRLLIRIIFPSFSFSSRKKAIAAKIISAAIKMMHPFSTYRDAVKIREKLYSSTKKSAYIANHSGAWGEKEIVPAEWYGEGCILEFEGMKVIAPAQYDNWLTRVYGDYMTLPPEEKRIARHHIDVFDLEKPYTVYTKKEKRK